MEKHSKILGKFLEKRRREKGLTRKDVASGLGFSNLGKWIWRIEQMENGHFKNPDFLSKVCDLLEVMELDLKRCEKEEEEKFRQYIDSLPPFKPHISMRMGSCSGKNFPIPEGITGIDGYLCYALGLVKSNGRTKWLWIDRDLSYEVHPDGKYY
ncbi:MAG TPA: XRE family transcriptional regulator, partial [bacterium]|nr:XRE family transcriptional regulator [bacterium]